MLRCEGLGVGGGGTENEFPAGTLVAKSAAWYMTPYKMKKNGQVVCNQSDIIAWKAPAGVHYYKPMVQEHKTGNNDQ